MKALFLAGGFAGFALCALAGFLAGRAPDLILRDAAIGCLAGALLVRWFWRVLLARIPGDAQSPPPRGRGSRCGAQQNNAPAKNSQPQKPSRPPPPQRQARRPAPSPWSRPSLPSVNPAQP